jgi:flagellar basal-body rod modification protein FlgD
VSSITDINNTLVQMSNDTNRVQFETGQKNLGTNKLDKGAFLQLLMTQLKYQDPTNPVDDKEFISQQAQFTQIEKLDDLTKVMTQGNMLAQASSLVGKRVEVKEGNNTFTGQVESALLGKDGIGIKVNGATYAPDQITTIYP